MADFEPQHDGRGRPPIDKEEIDPILGITTKSA